MAGYRMIKKIEQVEQRCRELGLVITSPRMICDQDMVAVYPAKDKLPVYAQDAELFVGTLEELEMWLWGIVWAREYDMILGACKPARRDKFEDNERKRQLMAILRKQQKEIKQ